jgi:hypothetical protein
MTDSFDPAVSRVPTKVPRLTVNFTVFNDTPNSYGGTYEFPIYDAGDQQVDFRNGNVVPHLATILTAQEITDLKAIWDKFLAYAVAQTIP